jgi:hypothetical protein
MSAYELAVKTLQAQSGSVAKAAQLLREAADLLDPPTAEAAAIKRARGELGGVAAAPNPLVAPTGLSGLSEGAFVGLLGGHVVDSLDGITCTVILLVPEESIGLLIGKKGVTVSPA